MKEGGREECWRAAGGSFTVNYRYIHTPKIVQRTNMYMLRVSIF